MSKVALVTGADRGLGLAIVEQLLEKSWTVIASQNLDWPELDRLVERYPDTLRVVQLDVSSDSSVAQAHVVISDLIPKIDMLIANAGINRSAHINSVREPLNFDEMLSEVNVNALGVLRVIKAFLPLLDRSELKRICVVSSEAGSVGASKRTGWFGYCMSKAAVNMAIKNLHNDLSPQGFSFRLYHPGWLRTYMRGKKAVEANMEPEEAAGYALNYFLSDQDPGDLVLHDFAGNAYPW